MSPGPLLALVVTLLVASVVIFGSLYLSPGDPAALLAGGSTPNPEALAQIREHTGRDRPDVTT